MKQKRLPEYLYESTGFRKRGEKWELVYFRIDLLSFMYFLNLHDKDPYAFMELSSIKSAKVKGIEQEKFVILITSVLKEKRFANLSVIFLLFAFT